MKSIRVAIVDDHTLFRDALGQLLGAQPDVDVVATAGDAQGAVRVVRDFAPDAVLLDVDMPGPGGPKTVEAIRRIAPDTPILMLSMYDDPDTIKTLLALGIRGYLLKTASNAELLAALRKVTTDRHHVVLSVTARLFDAPKDDPGLSAREVEILALAASALTNAQIAHRVDLKEATVKRHMHNIFVKLNAVSRIDAVNKAQQAGLLTRVTPSADPRG
ncbi:response regulator transcription factor [Actinomycetes bacterium M1A6_2h]